MKIFVLTLCIGLATLPQPDDAGESAVPLPPHVEFRLVHASQLYLGMPAAEVVRVMGDAPRKTNSSDVGVQVLNFPAEPIPTKVVLRGSKVSSISLDIARLDNSRLPELARKALRGMSSAGIRYVLGVPITTRHYKYFGTDLNQLIFERARDPAVSVFLVDDRVVTVTPGSAVPADIFCVSLPAPPDLALRNVAEESPVIGASASELRALFGTAKLQVSYRFNGQPAAHALYETRDHHTLSAYFVGGVLTEITDVGGWSIDDTSSG